MANIITRIAQRFGIGAGRAVATVPARTSSSLAARAYQAAMVSRLTSSWTTSSLSANADIWRSLDVLRARSRDMCQNNPYARKFLSMVRANIIGAQGFTLAATVMEKPNQPDRLANDAIEAGWSRWCAPGVCDVMGKSSFREICNQLTAAAARDGEFLVRLIFGKAAGNAFGFALQLLDIDRLDTQLNRAKTPGANAIRMGVEVDDYGRAVAYWLRTQHPGDMWLAGQAASGGPTHQRLEAREVIHGFIADRPEQLRGVPWMHAAMVQLNNLHGYEEAAIIAARVGASKMGFFTTEDGDARPLADGDGGGDEDGDIPYTDADPGTFGVLPKGVDFKSFDPDYPHAMFAEFVQAALRGVASATDTAYHSLGNNLNGVNFSSIRAGTLEERDLWMAKQSWFQESFVERVYAEWLRWALMLGQLTMQGGSALPIAKLDKFTAHTFQGRRWPWVDPMKDIQAARLQIQTGVMSPQQVAAQNGVDLDEVLDQIAAFEERVKAKRITSVSLAMQGAAPAPAADAAAAAEDAATAGQ